MADTRTRPDRHDEPEEPPDDTHATLDSTHELAFPELDVDLTEDDE